MDVAPGAAAAAAKRNIAQSDRAYLQRHCMRYRQGAFIYLDGTTSPTGVLADCVHTHACPTP